jgi:hypothetical protein
LHLSLTHDAVKDTLRLLERKRDEVDLNATATKLIASQPASSS